MHVEYWVRFQDLQCRSGTNILKWVQQRAMMMMKLLKHPTYEKRLIELRLFSQKRRLRGGLINMYKYPKGKLRRWSQGLSCSQWQDKRQWTQTGIHKILLKHEKKNLFPVRVVRLWKRLSREVLECLSLVIIKAELTCPWATCCSWPYSEQRVWTTWSPGSFLTSIVLQVWHTNIHMHKHICTIYIFCI